MTGEPASRKHSAPSPFKAGAFCRCPYCGRGPLYEHFLTVANKCRVCGRSFKGAEQGDGAAVFVIFVLGALVLAGALILEFKFDPPLWVHIAIWPAVVAIGSVLMLRPVKATLIAIQLQADAREGRLAREAAKAGETESDDE